MYDTLSEGGTIQLDELSHLFNQKINILRNIVIFLTKMSVWLDAQLWLWSPVQIQFSDNFNPHFQ